MKLRRHVHQAETVYDNASRLGVAPRLERGLDPLVHSLRWIRERPLDYAWLQIRRYKRDKGTPPARLIVSPRARHDLLFASGHDAWASGDPTGWMEERLWGIPLWVDVRATGITAAGRPCGHRPICNSDDPNECVDQRIR